MKQTCILVLGMHRSGTSALTGVLGLLDVYLADTTRGDENNKKGYFENSKVLFVGLIRCSGFNRTNSFFRFKKCAGTVSNEYKFPL